MQILLSFYYVYSIVDRRWFAPHIPPVHHCLGRLTFYTFSLLLGLLVFCQDFHGNQLLLVVTLTNIDWCGLSNLLQLPWWKWIGLLVQHSLTLLWFRCRKVGISFQSLGWGRISEATMASICLDTLYASSDH